MPPVPPPPPPPNPPAPPAALPDAMPPIPPPRDAAALMLEWREFDKRRDGMIYAMDGGLWLHSPIAIDEALAGTLAELGEVRHIVAPNRFHHMFAGAAKRRYPAAALWAAPGLRKKRSNVAFDRDLDEEAFVAEGIEATLIEGARPWSNLSRSRRGISSESWGQCLAARRSVRQ